MSLSIFFLKKNLCSLVISKLRYYIFLKNPFSGPEILIKSLINELKKKKINFYINKVTLNTKKILFIDDKKNLKKFINVDSEIYIGPNIMIMPNDDKIFKSKKISKILVPSQWIKNKYLKQTRGKISKINIWYSGVDENFWRPKKIISKKIDFLIYKKFSYDKEIYTKILNYLNYQKKNIKVIEYGAYERKEYYNLLLSSKALIFISQSESQGISNFEAWSCDVPTLVFNPGYWTYKNKKYISNSCPYLSKYTGAYFKNFDDFKEKITLFDSKKFSPRKWILKNGTINFTTKKLLNILKI